MKSIVDNDGEDVGVSKLFTNLLWFYKTRRVRYSSTDNDVSNLIVEIIDKVINRIIFYLMNIGSWCWRAGWWRKWCLKDNDAYSSNFETAFNEYCHLAYNLTMKIMVKPHNDMMLVNRQTQQRYLLKDISDRANLFYLCNGWTKN